MTVINILYWLLVVSSGFYFLLMIVLNTGWYKLKGAIKEAPDNFIKVSIVVALRNEEKSIAGLLRSIDLQDYPKEKIEIILVNDHSTDNTVGQIEQFIFEYGAEVRLIHALGEGKKKALREGYSVVSGELILTTDGDCELPADWVKRIVSFYEKNKPVLIIGSVIYKNESSFLQKLFSLDFMSLVASGAASAGHGLPFMGNGANLAFSALAYRAIAGQVGFDNYASGDDVFLIHKMAEKFGSKKIQFIKNADAIVYTKPPTTMKEFINQRVRWASKAKGYTNVWSIFVSLSVFFFNLMLFSILVSSFFINWFLVIYILFILFKFLLDFPLLYEFSGFSGKRKVLPLLFVFEFIYPFYIVVAAFGGFFTKFQWKGRKKLN